MASVVLHLGRNHSGSMRLSTVKLRRFERHLLQMQLAKRADIPCRRLAEIENGIAEPQPDELQRIAVELGVPLHQLLGSPRT